MMFLYIILLAIFIGVTWKNLETGILLICALLPSYLIRFSVVGIPTTFLEMMILSVVLVWMYKRGRTYDWKKWKQDSLLLPIILLLIAATIGIFVSPDKRAAFGVWKAFYVEPILMFVVIRDLLNKSSIKLESVFQSLGLGALLVSIFGLVQHLFSVGIPAPWDLEKRITSIFEYPNALALFLEPIIVLSWFEIRNAFKKKHKNLLAFWGIVSALATMNVFFAQSEAGLAALIFTAICILLFSKATRRNTLIALLISSALLFTIPTSRDYLIQKLTFNDFSETVRLSQWKETTELLKEHPIFGAGLSGYPILMKSYHQDLQFEIFQYPHNVLLNIWVELGMIGILASAWLARTLLFSKPVTSPLFFFLFLEIVIHSLVDVPYFKNDLALMTWILIACAVSVQHTSKK